MKSSSYSVTALPMRDADHWRGQTTIYKLTSHRPRTDIDSPTRPNSTTTTARTREVHSVKLTQACAWPAVAVPGHPEMSVIVQ
uniref:Uncharacterized protein n=1 Tax=Anopheles albimanus TaxID=7167 RepID=A0A182FVT7_ANOAL